MAEISDVFLRSQAEELVKKATNGSSGTTDWSSILKILSIIDSSPNIIPIFTSIICKHLANGKKGVSLNCLILVDALFKNSKKMQLTLLQSPMLIQQLNSPLIQRNPELHNFLFRSAPSWVAACNNQNCLDQYFRNWQQSICRSYYVPKMTESTKIKLHHDLEASFEVLTMFTQCLITSVTDSANADDSILYEILPNVREINKRLNELEPTIVDKNTRMIIESEKQFCELCQRTYASYQKKKVVDINALALSLSKTENRVQKYLYKPKSDKNSNTDKKREPIRKRGQPFDEMPVDEFFKQFDAIKKNSKSQPVNTTNNQSAEINLLDFNDSSQNVQSSTNQPQQDDLIDSLLQI